MNELDELESKSIYIIREAYHQFKGRFATLLVDREGFDDISASLPESILGEVPFPLMHIDTSYKFPEMYRFRDEYAKKWGNELIRDPEQEAIAAGMGPNVGEKLECCTQLKTNALEPLGIAKNGFKALLLGIRRDEHGIRAKGRVFLPQRGFQVGLREPAPGTLRTI